MSHIVRLWLQLPPRKLVQLWLQLPAWQEVASVGPVPSVTAMEGSAMIGLLAGGLPLELLL